MTRVSVSILSIAGLTANANSSQADIRTTTATKSNFSLRDRRISVIKNTEHYDVYNLPEKYKEFVPLKEAVGRQSADAICCYPPGRYVITEGERVTKEHIDYFNNLKQRDTNIHAKDPTLEKIYVLKHNVFELIKKDQKKTK